MSETGALQEIIVHGLWVHGLVMEYLAHQLKEDGFDAHTWSYPTMRQTLSENADHLAAYCNSLGLKRLNLVAHSMGGLVAMKMLERTPAIICERLVLIGTPYTDSAAARRLAQFPGGDWLLGRSIREWLDETRPQLRARQAGVIAGTRGFGLGALIGADPPQPHDGVVAVEETAVPGITEHIEVHAGHTEMLFSSEVFRQCGAFLRHGRFGPAS